MNVLLNAPLFLLCLIQLELCGITFMSSEFDHPNVETADTPFILKNKNISYHQKLENEYHYIVTTSNHSGIVNKDGKLILDTTFHAVSEPDFENQIIWAKKIMDYPPVINRDDTIVENDEYDWSFENITGNWQLFDLNGKLLSDSFFNQPYEFKDGIAEAYSNGINEFLINNSGRVLTKFNAEKIYFLNKNSCIFYEDSAFGFTDTNFQVVQQPYFDDMTHFVGNWALVSVNDTLGLVNHSGKYIHDVESYLYNESISITNLINLDTFANVYADCLHSAEGLNNIIPGVFSLDSIHQSKFRIQIKNHLILSQWRKLFLSVGEIDSELEIDRMSTMMADTFLYSLPTSPALEFNYTDYETEVNFCSSDLLSFYTCSIQVEGNTKREDEDRLYDYEFKHYARKRDTWKQIELSDLFFGNYKALITKQIMEQLKDDPACICQNIAQSAKLNLNHFTINEEGLEYYIYLCDTSGQIESFMNVLEIDVPYSDLKSAIPPTSPLFALMKRYEAVKD